MSIETKHVEEWLVSPENFGFVVVADVQSYWMDFKLYAVTAVGKNGNVLEYLFTKQMNLHQYLPKLNSGQMAI